MSAPDPIADFERRLDQLEREVAALKADAVQRYTLIQSVMTQGFADILSEIRGGFSRTNGRLDGIDKRLDAIEAVLRERGHNGRQADA